MSSRHRKWTLIIDRHRLALVSPSFTCGAIIRFTPIIQLSQYAAWTFARSKLVDRCNRAHNEWQLNRNFAILRENLVTLTQCISIATETIAIDSYGIYNKLAIRRYHNNFKFVKVHVEPWCYVTRDVNEKY